MKRGGRLFTVCSMLVNAKTVADVGCDHAYVAKYCAESGAFEHIIASDISESCLKKAIALLRGYDNVSFVCCDGIAYDCDEAVISGMGGMLVCDILREATCKPQTVIVCPHRDAATVRKTLLELGYGIDRDVAVEENGKYYGVIRATLDGGARNLSELQLLFGLEVAQKNEILTAWLIKQYNTYMVAPSANAEKLTAVRSALALQGVATDKINHDEK